MILFLWGLSLALAFLSGVTLQRKVTRRQVYRLAEVARVNQVKARQGRGW